MRARSTRAAVAALSLQIPAPVAAFIPLMALALLLATGSPPALAHDYTLGNLRIEHPYARPTPPGARTGGAYLTIRNAGTGCRSSAARRRRRSRRRRQLHSMTMEGNLMKMRAVAALDIPAGASVTLATRRLSRDADRDSSGRSSLATRSR